MTWQHVNVIEKRAPLAIFISVDARKTNDSPIRISSNNMLILLRCFQTFIPNLLAVFEHWPIQIAVVVLTPIMRSPRLGMQLSYRVCICVTRFAISDLFHGSESVESKVRCQLDDHPKLSWFPISADTLDRSESDLGRFKSLISMR